jgi:hypothetical protein
MGQLPQLISETSELRKRSDFEVLTVSFDDPERQSDVDKAIRDFKIKHTVVWDPINSTSLSNKADWNIKGFPTTLLINPDGVIQSSIDIDEHLEENLLYFLNSSSDLPPLGLSLTPLTDTDGKVVPDGNGEFGLSLDLYSPEHLPIDVTFSVNGGTLVGYELPAEEEAGEGPGKPTLTASFDSFGNYYKEFRLKPDEGSKYLFVVVSVPIPGTEELNDGAGLSTSSFRFIMLPQDEQAAE